MKVAVLSTLVLASAAAAQVNHPAFRVGHAAAERRDVEERQRESRLPSMSSFLATSIHPPSTAYLTSLPHYPPPLPHGRASRAATPRAPALLCSANTQSTRSSPPLPAVPPPSSARLPLPLAVSAVTPPLPLPAPSRPPPRPLAVSPRRPPLSAALPSRARAPPLTVPALPSLRLLGKSNSPSRTPLVHPPIAILSPRPAANGSGNSAAGTTAVKVGAVGVAGVAAGVVALIL